MQLLQLLLVAFNIRRSTTSDGEMTAATTGDDKWRSMTWTDRWTAEMDIIGQTATAAGRERTSERWSDIAAGLRTLRTSQRTSTGASGIAGTCRRYLLPRRYVASPARRRSRPDARFLPRDAAVKCECAATVCHVGPSRLGGSVRSINTTFTAIPRPHLHNTNSVIGVSRPPVLDCGTTFYLDYGGRDLPSTPSDQL